MPPRIREQAPVVLVIEVIDPDHHFWHAMANEWDRITIELENAPVAAAITIYEWHLLKPINPDPQDFWAKYPTWKCVSVRPWTIDG